MIAAEAQVCFLAVSKHEHKFMPGPVKRAHAAIALDPNTQVKQIDTSGAAGGKHLAHVAPLGPRVCDGENYGPLLKTPRALVVYARGGIYREDSVTPASHFDHQKGYFDFWLNFVGVKEVRSLVVESTTWGGKEKGEESIAQGKKEAAKLAADF
jgi:hypothetical protein